MPAEKPKISPSELSLLITISKPKKNDSGNSKVIKSGSLKIIILKINAGSILPSAACSEITHKS